MLLLSSGYSRKNLLLKQQSFVPQSACHNNQHEYYSAFQDLQVNNMKYFYLHKKMSVLVSASECNPSYVIRLNSTDYFYLEKNQNNSQYFQNKEPFLTR